jgi:MFS family permease
VQLSAAESQSQSPFRHRAFALYWFSRIASILSFHMLVVAVGWQLYELTGSAFDLGLLGLVQFIPMMVLTLFVGQAADRYDHRLILMGCQLTESVAAAILATTTLMGVLDIRIIYATVAVVGASRAFEIPTMAAIIPTLVPRPMVPRAMAWFASANQTGQIAGPSIGGVLYLLGPGTVYGITIALWALGAVMLAMMAVERGPKSTEPISLRSLFGGFRFVRHDRIIVGTLSLDMFAVFLGGATALLPIFARDILETDPWIRFSLVQLRTPAEMRGRVSAVNSLFTGTSNQLGDFRAGVMGALFGAVPAVAIGGLGTILVTAIWMFLFPELRRIRSLDEAAEAKAVAVAGTGTL